MTDRERINRILDKLDDEKVKEIYVFTSSYTGMTGDEVDERED